MDMNELFDGSDLSRSFVAGAMSVARERGMSEKDAEAFVDGVVKKAALGRYGLDGVEDTFWNRNKHWIIPALVGGTAFWLGSNSTNPGNPSYNAGKWSVTNAFRNIGGRLSTLFGLNETPVERMLIDKGTLEKKPTGGR